jgi:hypothetical protein
VQQSGQQIGQCFAGARSRFNDHVTLFFERAMNGFGHAHL